MAARRRARARHADAPAPAPREGRRSARSSRPAGRSGFADDEPRPTTVACPEAALAGWLQADGFVGQYDHGTNRSLTIEFQVANDEECAWVERNLDVAFPDVHRKVRDADTKEVPVQRIRLYGEVLRDFVERWEPARARHGDPRPASLWTASYDEIAAYLRSVFQADGYVTVRRDKAARARASASRSSASAGRRTSSSCSTCSGSTRGAAQGRAARRPPRPPRGRDLDRLRARALRRARRLRRPRKQGKLLESLDLRDPKRCPDLREEEIVAIEPLGVQDVYDIQTESGEYLSNNVAVHNCFILSVEDTMESILDWNTREGKIFLGGSDRASTSRTSAARWSR